MKRAANKTGGEGGGGGGAAGGGGGVALWQPTLKAAAPCFLIFPDHQNKPCVCVLVFVGAESLDLVENKAALITRTNFGIYLIRRIKHVFFCHSRSLLCKSRRHI